MRQATPFVLSFRSHSAGPARAAALCVLVAVGALALSCRSQSAPPPKAVAPERVTSFQRGVGLGLFATDADYDYGHLLDEITALGATDVLIVVSWYQTDTQSHDIKRRRTFTPTDDTVRRTLKQAKARGLRVALLPIVRLIKRSRSEWRGRIQPAAGEATWFDAYGRYVKTMATLAADAEIDRFGVGSELLTMERHTDHWRALIDDVRAVFKGKLFYSANWDHFLPIQFWDALDEVAVTAYFELARDLNPPSDAQLRAAWTRPLMELLRFASTTKKPLFISEVGYPSKVTAARFPWDETRAAPKDHHLQAQLYAAFCDRVESAPGVQGFYAWNWFGFGGEDDLGYTPRGKPAEAVLAECLQREFTRPVTIGTPALAPAPPPPAQPSSTPR